MSTAITIPSKMQPPPTKDEIISAMVERLREKHQAEQAELKKKLDAAKSHLDKAIRQHLRKSKSSFKERIKVESWGIEIELTMTTIPPHIADMRKLYLAMPRLRPFDEDEARKFVREGMTANRDDRVAAILGSPDAVKAIDAALNRIGA